MKYFGVFLFALLVTCKTDKKVDAVLAVVEKYNIEDMTLEPGGGEYPVQNQFWRSSGVYLTLKSYSRYNQ